MTDIVIHGDVAQELQRISEREKRPVDDVVRSMIERYGAQTDTSDKEDALNAFIGAFDDDVTDLSSTVRETMEDYYRKKYGAYLTIEKISRRSE
jgi:hypothetical protein